MKKVLSFLLSALLILGLTACTPAAPVGSDPTGTVAPESDFVVDGSVMKLTRGDVTVTLDAGSGMVKSVETGYDRIDLDGVLVDAGINEAQVFNQLGYKDMSGLATYELPTLYPRMKDMPAYTVRDIRATAEGFEVSIQCGEYGFLYRYGILPDALSVDVILSATSAQPVAVNGIGFLVRGIQGYTFEDATFEFPGSTPAGKKRFAVSGKYKAVSADYSAPAVVLDDGVKSGSVLFVDQVEKWTTGSYSDENQNLCVAFLAAAEGWLSADRPMEVGTLYLPLKHPDVSAYQSISGFWEEIGFHTPGDTTSTEDLVAIYSAHPYGTMDANYFNKWKLDEYAEKMDAVAAMGFDAVWLLPVFSHTGDNGYEPIDQGVIDPRYGGIEAAKVFVDTAHGLGMQVLFDFVPHGPRPAYSFAKDHDDWISKNKAGSNQIEWECVSFDYNNPDYNQYNIDLAKYYAEEIGLDGARIDCSMGGLPNWSSPTGLRASAAGLQAGITVVRALREGFIAGGSDVLLLPENFHPSPAYASVPMCSTICPCTAAFST